MSVTDTASNAAVKRARSAFHRGRGQPRSEALQPGGEVVGGIDPGRLVRL
ncbi:hypothetical protein [Streptomyces bicolor]|nr:hypothetical protein [Streptomyces bicolor]